MKVNVWNSILQLSKERGVDASVVVKAIEESLKVASSQYFSHNEKINIFFLPEKGEIRVYAVKKVTKKPQDPATEISIEEAKKIVASAEEGNEIEINLPSETLGRIAAQAAKQVILQKVRDAEQEKIYNLFAPRTGEIITGVLRRFEKNKNMILEVNKTDVLLPYREKLINEEFKRGDRVKAVIIQVLRDNKGPQVIVSRTDTKFLARLLESEVPEITEGIIEIKNLVHQPGERAKVAVFSKEKDIDPIGACIGVKGNRILSISKELQGEKIDIIPWSSDPLLYAKTALSPAKITKVLISNEKDKTMQAVVPRDQLSLAIGKKGVNVRLASRLVGWKIEVIQA
jgi:N utilization substance protein A